MREGNKARTQPIDDIKDQKTNGSNRIETKQSKAKQNKSQNKTQTQNDQKSVQDKMQQHINTDNMLRPQTDAEAVAVAVAEVAVSVAEPKSEPGLHSTPLLLLVIGQKSVGSSRRSSSVRMTTLRAKSMSTFLLPVVCLCHCRTLLLGGGEEELGNKRTPARSISKHEYNDS